MARGPRRRPRRRPAAARRAGARLGTGARRRGGGRSLLRRRRGRPGVPASGTDEVDDAVESALMLGLVEDGEPGRYRFSHALVRDAVYEGLAGADPGACRTPTSRSRWRTGTPGSCSPHVGELAEHYRLAGPAHARSAWVFARRAAHAAAEQSAHDEALRLFEEAAALQDLDPSVTGTRARGGAGRPRRRRGPSRPADRGLALGRAGGRVGARARRRRRGGRALLTVTDRHGVGVAERAGVGRRRGALWSRVLDRVRRGCADAAPLLRPRWRSSCSTSPGPMSASTRLADAAVQAVRRSGTRDAVRLARAAASPSRRCCGPTCCTTACPCTTS